MDFCVSNTTGGVNNPPNSNENQDPPKPVQLPNSNGQQDQLVAPHPQNPRIQMTEVINGFLYH